MKQSTIPTIVIIITAVAALLVFATANHSGLSVTNCTFEEDVNQDGMYNLTYTLLVGRHFNLLDCQYTLYSSDNKILSNGSAKIKDAYIGSFPVTDTFALSDEDKHQASHVEIVIYTKNVREEDGVNKTTMEKSYTKTINL